VSGANGAAFDGAVVAEIDRRLQALSSRERVTILLAVESGSRAWGFPSPDSDYDCRFIYARRVEDYLSLHPARDVIEEPSDRVLDIGGWDLAKALRLLIKGNAVVVEWLTSPFVYAGDDRFRAECLALSRQVVRPAAVARHYLHLGERQRRTYFVDLRAIPLKKIFYALRPAVALRWLRLHDEQAVVPMHFPTLVAQTDLPGDVAAVIDDLMARKAATRELGSGPLPEPIGALIDAEFAVARVRWPAAASPPDPAARRAADELFRRWIAPASTSPQQP
jgi:predicted nucleotidyltransferase